MLRTYYAGGRESLPAPVITLQSGTMNGGGSTYYFWIVARNRVGYNNPSPVTSITIPASRSINISNTNFTSLEFEDWRELLITINNIDDYSTSRVIYEQNTEGPLTPPSVIINTQLVLNGDTEVATPANLPVSNGLPNGYRVRVTSLNNTYKYSIGSTLPVDNLTVIAYGGSAIAQWVLVPSGNINEFDVNFNKELYQVSQYELQTADIPANSAISDPVLYYIKNTNVDTLTEGELDLNIYKSDSSLKITAKIKVIGYLNMNTYVLDTLNIPYVGNYIQYPDTKIQITKPLAVNSALVFEVIPEIDINQTVLPGTFISLYPRINSYTVVDKVLDWAEGVDSISTLQGLPESIIKNQQSVHVISLNKIYTYNSSSTLAPDGDSVIKPSFNPVAGRWIATSSTVLNESITLEKLAPEVTELLEEKLTNTSQILNTSTNFTLNFDTITNDYFILTTPDDDAGITIFNFNSTSIENGETASKLLELVQRTGEFSFHSSILFPGGNIPVLSGAGKTDLILLTLRKDTAGNIKKRAVLLQKHIG